MKFAGFLLTLKYVVWEIALPKTCSCTTKICLLHLLMSALKMKPFTLQFPLIRDLHTHKLSPDPQDHVIQEMLLNISALTWPC